jgi:hypothetical protein
LPSENAEYKGKKPPPLDEAPLLKRKEDLAAEDIGAIDRAIGEIIEGRTDDAAKETLTRAEGRVLVSDIAGAGNILRGCCKGKIVSGKRCEILRQTRQSCERRNFGGAAVWARVCESASFVLA